MSSPFSHYKTPQVQNLSISSNDLRMRALTITLFLCPLPSQYEYVTSISSFLVSSCFFNHSCRRRSLSFRSSSSLSRSGRNDVSTFGFLRNLPRLAGGSSSTVSFSGVDADESSPSSSMANESVALGAFLRFFTFFVSSLNRFSTIYKPSDLPKRANGRKKYKLMIGQNVNSL